jgi:hypothetical protein
MTNRREFLGTASTAGLASACGLGAGAARSEAAGSLNGRRDLYELRRYVIVPDQRQGFDAFMRDAAIPAFNRIGIAPVGVFFPRAGAEPDPRALEA